MRGSGEEEGGLGVNVAHHLDKDTPCRVPVSPSPRFALNVREHSRSKRPRL